MLAAREGLHVDCSTSFLETAIKKCGDNACRYDHVGCSLHVKKCGIELHARPWHWGWRPVLGDHFLNK